MSRDIQRGTIKRIIKDKGFGFITGPDGRDVFFHRTGVAKQAGTFFELLEDGDPVLFRATQSDKGPRAEDVQYADGAAGVVD